MRYAVIQVRLPEELLQKLNEWRREQQDIPSKAEAVRRLLLKALADEA